jgi:hypothetical protein
MVDPSATVTQAPVITMIIDSATVDGPRALFELGEAATRTESANRPRQRSNLGDRSGHEHIAKHVLDFPGPIRPCWAIHLPDRHQVCSRLSGAPKRRRGSCVETEGGHKREISRAI